MKNLLVCIFILSIEYVQSEKFKLCEGKNLTDISDYILQYCEENQGYLVQRCCRAFDNQTFIAVDLTDFNLIKIPDFYDYQNFNLSVIDLRSNPNLFPSLDDEDFLTLKYLNTLILPQQFACPGGDRIWQVINRTRDQNFCAGQLDFCTNSTDLCVEHGSYCSTNGPNHFQCLCQHGYHGYKCLRNGKFPTAAFFGSTVGATIFLSTILYWTQRRHVIK